MANWNGLILTTKGIALLSKVEAGTTLEMTKIKLGDGVLPDGQNLEDLTDLVSPKQILGIAAREAQKNEDGEFNGFCKISSTISNVGLTQGYYVRELGIFANDPDAGEILYAVTTDTAPDYLPAQGGATVISQEFALYVAISNMESIEVQIDPGALATMGYVKLSINEHNSSADSHAAAFAKHNADSNAHYDMTGATSSKAGKRGFVPAPQAGEQNKALFGDAEYRTVVQSINDVKPDENGKVTLITGINILARRKAYTYGDIAYSPNLPSWAYLYCVQAGTTAVEEPSFTDVNVMGKYITDGTVKWIVDDVRFNIPVGVPFYDAYLHAGCVKFNGATVKRSDYIRLAKIASDNNLWTDNPTNEPWKYGKGDGSTTMVLPDYRDRVIQGGDMAQIIKAGIPNIEGTFRAIMNRDLSLNTGAIWATYEGTSYIESGSYTGFGAQYFRFDASKYNAIYGTAQTVQPPAISLIPQIKI